MQGRATRSRIPGSWFGHSSIAVLARAERLLEEFAERPLEWEHSGYSVHAWAVGAKGREGPPRAARHRVRTLHRAAGAGGTVARRGNPREDTDFARERPEPRTPAATAALAGPRHGGHRGRLIARIVASAPIPCLRTGPTSHATVALRAGRRSSVVSRGFAHCYRPPRRHARDQQRGSQLNTVTRAVHRRAARRVATRARSVFASRVAASSSWSRSSDRPLPPRRKRNADGRTLVRPVGFHQQASWIAGLPLAVIRPCSSIVGREPGVGSRI
jgi:hypothetical protein